MTRLQDIPWVRILAESVAIIFSILLAFAIDAWWADRQIRVDIQENLLALKGELESNLGSIDQELSYRRAVISSIEALDEPNTGEGGSPPNEVDALLGDLLWIGKSGFSTGALNSTLQSGLLTHIEDGELRRLLAALPTDYEYVQQFESRDAESTVNGLYSYIMANGSFNQIANTQDSGRPGTGEIFGLPDPNYRVNEYRDHSQFLKSEHFLGLLTHQHWNHLDVLAALQRLRPKVERAIALIDQQVAEPSSF